MLTPYAILRTINNYSYHILCTMNYESYAPGLNAQCSMSQSGHTSAPRIRDFSLTSITASASYEFSKDFCSNDIPCRIFFFEFFLMRCLREREERSSKTGERKGHQKGEEKSSKMKSFFARPPFLALPREEVPRP